MGIKSADFPEPTALWDGDLAVGALGDGTSWADAKNWTTDDVADVAPSDVTPGDIVRFAAGPTVSSIDLGADRTVDSLEFQDDYTLNGHTLTILNKNVTVALGVTATIDSDITAPDGLRKLSEGTLSVGGTTGDVTVNSGTLTVHGTTGDVLVQNGTLTGDGTLGSVSVLGGATLMAMITQSGSLTAGEVVWSGGALDLVATEQQASLGDFSRTITDALVGFPVAAPPLKDGAGAGHIGYGVFVEGYGLFGAMSVHLFQAAAGDVNGDGVVDSFDIQAILVADSFNNPAGGPYDWFEGDFTGDGLVDALDIQAILVANVFNTGQYAAQATSVTTVPEPSTFILALLALVGLLACGHRRRRS